MGVVVVTIRRHIIRTDVSSTDDSMRKSHLDNRKSPMGGRTADLAFAFPFPVVATVTVRVPAVPVAWAEGTP
jgi:hypothetical protein